jgi:DNA-binding CsgD family transcriptional regulator
VNRRAEVTEGVPATAASDEILRLGDEAAADLARIASAALRAALEAIPSPAFVVRLPATVLQANVRGRSLLANDRDRVLGVMRSTTPPPRGPVRFAIESSPDHLLMVVHDLEGDARSRLEAVTRRWGLTPRQSAVLALVAQGESNRTVAGRLGCSEKTVELHVSALLAKTRCLSRSQLVASFWTDLG